jgi:predicted nucleic acid-binding protein
VIIVDTSAWVEFLRATGSEVDAQLTAAIRGRRELGVLDVVRLELLAGARDDAAAEDLRRLLARYTPVPAASSRDHELAAALYREARVAGHTVRSLLDCLIAAAALRLDAPLLARDRDYDVLAEVSSLRVL